MLLFSAIKPEFEIETLLCEPTMWIDRLDSPPTGKAIDQFKISRNLLGEKNPVLVSVRERNKLWSVFSLVGVLFKVDKSAEGLRGRCAS